MGRVGSGLGGGAGRGLVPGCLGGWGGVFWE